MAKLKTLEDFFIEELKDLYSAEKQLTKALPKMAKAASSEELQEAFESHLKETEGQVARLEKISKILGRPLTGKKCAAMEGLVEEGKEIMEEESEPEVLDVALIAAAQKVEHYEIASYGCAVTYARLLEQEEVQDLLQETLDEESAADEKLTGIAEELNAEAMQPAESEE
jgi:ferritin-like metal-binding protein YciE